MGKVGYISAMQNFVRYYAAVRYLEGLSNTANSDDYMKGSKRPYVYLQRMRYFCNVLGNPEKGPKYIHITGTAGKGSVAHMIYTVLVRCGLKVGLFTSPFVTTTVEKFSINGLYIHPNEFADIIEEIKPVIDRMFVACPYGRPSYFEICTAIAFLYFKRQQCDWVVIEVGCGGRYDSTNVIPAPVASVITNIGYDHTKILGKTLTKIAYEKAGIIKPGCRLYTTERQPRLRQMFANMCEKLNVPMTYVSTPDTNMSVEARYTLLNKALARLICCDMGIAGSIIEQGIREARLPCRFEIMQKHPLVILDGAHNDSKLATTIENIDHCTYQRLFLILGMAANKEAVASLRRLVERADIVIITRFQIKERKAFPPDELLTLCKKVISDGKRKTKQFFLFTDPYQALDFALDQADADDAILATGSFFLTGDIRTRWVSEGRILQTRTSF